jgi:hypothetical protein
LPRFHLPQLSEKRPSRVLFLIIGLAVSTGYKTGINYK